MADKYFVRPGNDKNVYIITDGEKDLKFIHTHGRPIDTEEEIKKYIEEIRVTNIQAQIDFLTMQILDIMGV